MLETLLFDNDGVLVDTEQYYFLANRMELAEHGIDMDFTLYRELFLRQNLGVMKWFSGKSDAFIADYRKRRKARYMRYLETEPIAIEGAEEALSRLSARFNIGIVTSSEKAPFDLIHQRTGFAKHFDFVVANEDVTVTKPDPEPYLEGLARAGGDRGACIVIEDSERGLRSAVAAGIPCWVVPTAMTEGGDFSKAARHFTSLGELANALLDEGT